MNTTRKRKTRNGQARAQPTQLRVAIYTRKSTEHGLEQEFNSIDAQRHAVECYAESQRGSGWIVLPQHYDDGGFSGATTARPAFRQLLTDIEAGAVDCVAVYRIDRLSRSFADYVAILKLFEDHDVTFVSVTEQFNTTTPTGRMVLNQLILFSQFEREVTAERIRDKVQATRRRGMWTGGRPVLGYDVVEKKLVVHENEADEVRGIFELYMERGSIRETVAELSRRGWHNKTFITKSGREITGRPFSKATLHNLLTNVLYRGQIRCMDDTAEGVHDSIVSEVLWESVQERLRGNGHQGGSQTRNKTGAILRGLVSCGRCGSPMLHTFTTKSARRYRYYVCSRNHNEGVASCPDARVSAGRFERFVVDQVRIIGKDKELLARTAASLATQAATRKGPLTSERGRIVRERRRLNHVAEADDRVRVLKGRLAEVHAELNAIGDATVDKEALRNALAGFTPIWEQLFPLEQERILRLLIEKITYDPDSGAVDIELQPCGINTLAEEARETS